MKTVSPSSDAADTARQTIPGRAEPGTPADREDDGAPVVETLARVRSFYDHVGWKKDQEGVAGDTRRFGVREDGPIRQSLHRLRLQRIRAMLLPELSRPSLLECGCGGNPAMFLAEACASYTGVDFSQRGLDLARQRLAAAGVPAALVKAELSALPFADNTFDAVYSAHALYHIADAATQARALQEIMRVLRPGGSAALVLSNPRPLLFPLRLARRLIADMPGLSEVFNRLRRTPPLPYKPMPLGWMRRRLKPHGSVSVGCYAVASMWFAQHVSEHRMPGRLGWEMIAWLERRMPRMAARLGNYVIVSVRKNP